MQNPSAPEWVDFYEIHEQTRQNVAGKRGKARPIMDIEFERHYRGPRPRLGFEAKRLGPGYGIGKYLGKDGLAAFLTGYYPITHGEAGMLGYVQKGTCDAWSSKLKKALTRNKKKHRVRDEDGGFTAGSEENAPCYYSRHIDANSEPLLITQVLLSFTQ